MAVSAERILHMDPSACVLNCRPSMEFTVKWMYSVDGSLTVSYQDSVVSLMNTEDFRGIIGVDIWRRMDFIRKMGNMPPIPLNTPADSIPNCTINGCKFVRIPSSKEQSIVGRALHNCLSHYVSQGTLYAVKKNGRYVCAMEMEGRNIRQAYRACNGDIEVDDVFYCIFEAWRHKFGIQRREETI